MLALGRNLTFAPEGSPNDIERGGAGHPLLAGNRLDPNRLGERAVAEQRYRLGALTKWSAFSKFHQTDFYGTSPAAMYAQTAAILDKRLQVRVHSY